MFVKAIETASSFTRPILSISRNYGSTTIQRGAATLFFVNSNGWALTCRHVAELLVGADRLAANRQAFLDELHSVRGHKKEIRLQRELEKRYGFSKSTSFEIYNHLFNCVEGPLNAEIKVHDKLDVALIHFHGFVRLLCDSFPIFAINDSELKQGKFLCRLGYPFAEFSNFSYDSQADRIQWTNTGRADTPQFPIEGMVTRYLAGDEGQVIGFEMSTPGLRGQSGGPVFDQDGRVWGMQAMTAHLDLDFDVNQEVIRNGAKKRVNDSAFLHVGHCVHVNVLKSFMRQHGVRYEEG